MDIDRALVRKRIELCRRGEGLVKSWKVKGTNNFIQLFLNGLRINFYLPSPGDVVESPPHTHDLGFTSTVLYGAFTNTVLDVEEDPDGLYERCTLLKPTPFTFQFHGTGQRCDILRETPTVYHTGDTYSTDPRQYHKTVFGQDTITYMRRWQEKLVQTFHLVPYGRKMPLLPKRAVTKAELPGIWRIIDGQCEKAGI